MTLQEMLEAVTNTTGTRESVSAFVDWSIDTLKEAISTAAPSVATTAVKDHIAALEAHKTELAEAIVANTGTASQGGEGGYQNESNPRLGLD